MADEQTPTESQPTTPTDDAPLGDAGKKALDAERDARKAAEKEARDAKARLAQIEADAQKAKDAEAAEQGKWKELAEKRDADLAEATSKLTATTTELDTLRTYVTDDIVAAVKVLPKALVAFDPGEDAPIAQRLAWLTKAKAAAAELDKQTPRGNGGDPKPGGNPKIDADKAVANARRRISI